MTGRSLAEFKDMGPKEGRRIALCDVSQQFVSARRDQQDAKRRVAASIEEERNYFVEAWSTPTCD